MVIVFVQAIERLSSIGGGGVVWRRVWRAGAASARERRGRSAGARARTPPVTAAARPPSHHTAQADLTV